MATSSSETLSSTISSQRNAISPWCSRATRSTRTFGDNMSFALKLRGLPKQVREETVRRAAAILGLEKMLDRYPRQLSGGQRQRVAMGRAIVRDPKVFLFDEPLSNLDAKLRVAMRAEIKELHQKLGVTTVYVTHDQIEAMTMADRIVVMRDGRVEQIGSPIDLYENPVNLFVATFIGSPSMSVLDGEVILGDRPAVQLAGGNAVLPLPVGAAADAGVVKVGIRPEHLEVSDNGFPADVVVVEPTGSETHVLFRVGGQDITGVFRQKWAHKPGTRLQLRVDPAQIYLFEPSTGRRL